VLLPAYQGELEAEIKESAPFPSGHERSRFIDDEAAILKLVKNRTQKGIFPETKG